MDSLGAARSQLMAVLDVAIESGLRASRDRSSGQSGLFGELLAAGDTPEPSLPNVADWSSQEKLAGEKEMLGYYVTGHPLDQFMDRVPDLRTHTSGNLDGLAKGTEVKLCGILTGIARKRNRDGKPWAAMQLEDHDGSIEALAFTTVYETLSPHLVEDRAVLVKGLVLPEEGAAPKISIQDLIPLENARVNLPSLVGIRVPLGINGMDRAAELQRLFARKPGDARVRVRLEKPKDFSVTLDVPFKVRPDKEFRAEIERICGPEAFETM
jgi:DNA polymerase-3 subunit alpha